MPLPSGAQVGAASEGAPTHSGEPHAGASAGRLNWLRAGVLGANDGIVSVAGIVLGVEQTLQFRELIAHLTPRARMSLGG